MVDEFGHPRIMDLGLASIVRDPSSVESTADGHGLSLRWTAPEVIQGAQTSKKSDVFSFAMVIYEVRVVDAGHSNRLIRQFRFSLGKSRSMRLHRT